MVFNLHMQSRPDRAEQRERQRWESSEGGADGFPWRVRGQVLRDDGI
jgi:hypothetical protein